MAGIRPGLAFGSASRTVGAPGSAMFQIPNFYDMGDLRIRNPGGDRGQPFSDIAGPVVTAATWRGLRLRCTVQDLGQ